MVNRNSRAKIAQETLEILERGHWFYDHLVDNPIFQGRFKSVVFAVTDWSDERRLIGPFEKRFSSG